MELALHDDHTQDDIRKAKQVIKECDRLELDIDESQLKVKNFENLQIRHDSFIYHGFDGDLAKLYRNGFAINQIGEDTLFIRPIKGEETSAPTPEPLKHVDGEVEQRAPGEYLVKTT